MACQLRLTAEIAEWLGDLRDSDPVTATEVGAAVLALMEAADATSLAFVTGTHEPSKPDPREQLDHGYQRLLEALQQLRRGCAEAAARRRQLELRLGEDAAAAERDRTALASLDRQLAAARRREDVLTEQKRRLQLAVDSLRTQKETAKAMVTAAEARRRIADAFRAAGIEADDSQIGAADLETADQALARAYRLLRSGMAAAGLSGAEQGAYSDPDDPAVLELRADPLGVDIRLLFGLEPPGTAVLLAALEGQQAISMHRDHAVDLARKLLAEIRHDGWSSETSDAAASGPEFADPGTFLETCFPGNASVIAQRATELASAASLRSLRGERDLAEIARAAGIDEDNLRVIERDGLQGATVRDAAAYVRALGGRLELTAVIDGERHPLTPAADHESL